MEEHMVDLLVHAHDIQGLGHISRSVAIAAALRRLKPDAKVILVTSSPIVSTLVGGLPIDWIKLPSYGSYVKDGRQYHTANNTNLPHGRVQKIRSQLLAQLLQSYQPRCVLVDHRPMGQCRELIQCLDTRNRIKPLWLLGLRAVVGNVEGVWDNEAAAIVKRHYAGILWYADPSLVQRSYRSDLESHFGVEIHTAGYVSRALELERWGLLNRTAKESKRIAVAITWESNRTGRVIRELNNAISLLGTEWAWDIFVADVLRCDGIDIKDNVRISNLDSRYLSVLQRASAAIVFAGCNSILDLCWAQTPAVCIVREMENQEQRLHCMELRERIPGLQFVHELSVEAQGLVQLLRSAVHGGWAHTDIEDRGAERAASFILSKVT